jgi:sirohydrochlorin cobaltochelatase
MSNTILLMPSRSRAVALYRDLVDFCATLSTYVQEDVGLWMIDEDEWARAIEQSPSIMKLEQMDHHGEPLVMGAPMSAAPFAYRDDGRPDWGAMWTGFCELALYGGPPHRGPDEALPTPQAAPDEVVRDAMVDEMVRGIFETTDLVAEPSPGGWLRVACDSKRMAAWLCATIILENVDARVEEEFLFVPGDRDFQLKDQVKSVITVVAKSNHYWQAHIANENGLSEARAQARSILLGENIVKLRGAA